MSFLTFVLFLLFPPSFCSIGGGFDDHVEGDSGMDLVFGDHGEIQLSENIPYTLVYASTIDAGCTPGTDNVTLGKDDDIAFGGETNSSIRVIWSCWLDFSLIQT